MNLPDIRVAIQQPSLAKYRNPVFRELANRDGIELYLAFGNRTGLSNAEPDGFEADLWPLTRKRLGSLPFYWHQPQISLAKKSKCDVLICTWNSQYLSLIPGLLRARLNRVGTIVWGHGYSKKEGVVRLAIRKWITRFSNAVLFYDNVTRNRYCSEYGLSDTKSFTALNSIDQEPIKTASKFWRSNPENLHEFKKSNGLGEHVILFVSRLHKDNRVDLLVEATKRLLPEFPDLKTVIIGKGVDEQRRLEALATEAQVEKQLIFTGPIYKEKQLAAYFLSSSVFCYPANIGLSLLHAFGYGLTVVTSDKTSGQNPEIYALKNGINGVVYEHENVQDMTTQLRGLLRNKRLRIQMATNAFETVNKSFNITKMVNGMEAAIRYAYSKYNCTKQNLTS